MIRFGTQVSANEIKPKSVNSYGLNTIFEDNLLTFNLSVFRINFLEKKSNWINSP